MVTSSPLSLYVPTDQALNVFLKLEKMNTCVLDLSPSMSVSLPGMIDQLAYVSPHEYRFDEGARSVVCTVSSDCTVRAWDLQEVSCPLGRECLI